MSSVKISAFGGMIPALDDALLPDHAAAHSANAWLYSGALVGLPKPAFLRNLPPNTNKVYRIPNNYVDTDYLEDSVWLDFQHLDTDVIRSPIIDDTHDRYYWASPLDPPKVNSRARIAAGQAAFYLGVPAPVAAPTLALVGGVSATTVSRAYVYTWVTGFGEEGAPSPPVLATGKLDAAWNLTIPAAIPADITDRNLTKTRIYRTTTSSSGDATYFFVAEIPIATLTYSDIIDDAVVTANEQMSSTTWTPPPSDLAGWVSMPNGMIAGWRNNELWFCEPYRPHAWPARYTLTVEYPIVGLGVDGQTLVVCTAGFPTIATGLNPESMSQSTPRSFEPCHSRGSILSTSQGVLYASPNGLVSVVNGVATNITQDIIKVDEWQALLQVATLRTAQLGSAIYMFGSARYGVFDEGAFDNNAFVQEDFRGAFAGAAIDPSNQRVAFNILTCEEPTTNVFNDAWSSNVLIIRDGKLYAINLTDRDSEKEVVKWRSKKFQTANNKNLAVVSVDFVVPPWAPVLNPVINPALEQELAADQWGLVRVYADGRLVTTRELRVSGEVMRIASGFKAGEWQFEIEARVRVTGLRAATSARGLVNA